MDKRTILEKLDPAWTAFKESFADLGGGSAEVPAAHPRRGPPPRYTRYGGIDAFNAKMTEEKRNLSLNDVLRQLGETHGRLIDLIRRADDAQFRSETHRTSC